MAAVIRVKRRINEEPLNAFILNCKRRRVDDEEVEDGAVGGASASNANETSTIVKFAGTVNSQDDDFMQLTKERAKKIITKTRNPDLTSKSREDHKQTSQNNRFKIVNCTRPVDFETDQESESNSKFTVVDIEKHNEDEEVQHASTSSITESINDNLVSTENDYVYDVYLPDGGMETNFDDSLLDNLLSVQPIDLVYDYRGPNDIGSDDDDNASEDSNSENNWRNEYPESDDSIGVEEMRHAVANFGLDDEQGSDYNLSSDDEEEALYQNEFVTSIDSDGIGFEDDVDYCDVSRYGVAYARYKARVIKQTLANPESSDVDDYSLDYD